MRTMRYTSSVTGFSIGGITFRKGGYLIDLRSPRATEEINTLKSVPESVAKIYGPDGKQINVVADVKEEKPKKKASA